MRRRILLRPKLCAARAPESGFAYLLALFTVLIVAAGSLVVLANGKTERRRQKEADMIWRGEQYERAIKAYFRKTGHYPRTVEDLQKGLPDLHFLRYAAYKDPMNASDGAWRFIYINAAGQIIGSVKYATLQQMALLDQPGAPKPGTQPGLGVPASSLASSGSNSSDTQDPNATILPPVRPQDASGQNPPNPQGSPNPPNAQNPQNPAQSGFGPSPQPSPGQPGSLFGQLGGAAQAGAGGLSTSALLDMKPTGPVDGPVLGGFLTGVASKVDKKSLKIYKGGTKYKQWEFIWNPLEDQLRATQQALSGGGAATSGLGQAISSAFSTAFGNQTGGPGLTPPQNLPQPLPQQPIPQPQQLPQ